MRRCLLRVIFYGNIQVLKFVISDLERLAHEAGLDNEGIVEIAAPTGVAANAIGGQTLHAMLQIPVNAKELPELSITDATNLRNNVYTRK